MRKVSLKRKRNGNTGENSDDAKPEENNQNGDEVDPLDGVSIEKVTSTTTKKRGSEKAGKKGAKKSKTSAKSPVVDEDEDENHVEAEENDAQDKSSDAGAPVDDEEEYEVEDIVDHKTVRGKIQYLIRWKGYDADNDTWEPENTLNCPEIIERYKNKNITSKKSEKKTASKANNVNKDEGVDEENEAGVEENDKGQEEDEANSEDGDAASEKEQTKTSKKTPKKKFTGRSKKTAYTKRKDAKAAADALSDVDEDDDKNKNDDGADENGDDETEYEVEKIVDVHFKKNGEREFLIRWKGFKSDADTWEPESNVNCADLIEKYMKKVSDAKSKDTKELRQERAHTKRFTLATNDSGRRISRRHNNKQRVSYFETE